MVGVKIAKPTLKPKEMENFVGQIVVVQEKSSLKLEHVKNAFHIKEHQKMDLNVFPISVSPCRDWM